MVRSRELMQNCVLIFSHFTKATSHSNIWCHEIGHNMLAWFYNWLKTKVFFFSLLKKNGRSMKIFLFICTLFFDQFSIIAFILNCLKWIVFFSGLWISYASYYNTCHISGRCFPCLLPCLLMWICTIPHSVGMQNTSSQGNWWHFSCWWDLPVSHAKSSSFFFLFFFFCLFIFNISVTAFIFLVCTEVYYIW